ncbi:MAG: hypothetical protein IKB61_01860 [Elusimicrobiaceae bacterium]|nr:hypothetical protein [Elusimicrobiaceae bacterium]
MNKTIKTYTKKAEDILAASNAQIQEINNRLVKEREKAEEYKEAMTAAWTAADPAAHRTAKRDYEDVTDGINMYSDRLEALKSKRLVSEGEYNEAVTAIMAALAEEDKQARKKLVELTDEMKKVTDQLSATLDEGNKLLHTWQHDIFKDDAHKVTPQGTRIYRPDLEKRYREYSTISFSKKAFDSLDELRK